MLELFWIDISYPSVGLDLHPLQLQAVATMRVLCCGQHEAVFTLDGISIQKSDKRIAVEIELECIIYAL